MDPDTEQVETGVGTGTKTEMPEPERVAPKKVDQLPPSSDKEFWGEDAEMHSHDASVVQSQVGEHKIKQFGQDLVCVSCPHPHTVSTIS